MKIAVIPARGGSKRIPRKNIKLFSGKPMIAWSISIAQESGLFDKVIVSTDDSEIADIARTFGATVPFTRPANLSDDYATTGAVLSHATRWALESMPELQALCCIYATAPLIQKQDLLHGWKAMASGHWDYTFTATQIPSTIFRAFTVERDSAVKMLFPEHYLTRSQDLPALYQDAGQFYWGTPKAWLEERPMFQARSKAIPIPAWRAQDIDTIEDWTRCELIALQMLNNQDARS